MSFLKNIIAPKPTKSGIIFIVEDNPVYAKALESSLRAKFPELKDVKIFPVGETCLLELDKNPDLIIIDYFLDSKYFDAETGREIVQKIRQLKPEMNILLLSAQNETDIFVDSINKFQCSYVKKDAEAFSRVEEIVREAI
jgi:two-component system OmpR family response regulator